MEACGALRQNDYKRHQAGLLPAATTLHNYCRLVFHAAHKQQTCNQHMLVLTDQLTSMD
jgi:hypothetical protein